MAKPRFGGLPPRYTFFLNPYTDYRFTRCPNCDQPTRLRKFVLFIHVDPDHLLSMGKTCRFCPKCEWLIAHQDEVESELAILFNRLDPKALGNDYLIIGTVERKVWREGLRRPKIINEILPHVADFKEVRRVEVRPAGWYSAEK